jgi:uncharacterized protein (DUF433 family)
MQAFQAKPPPLTRGEDGVIRFSGTRVQLELVVEAFDAGATPEEIVQRYPSLDLASIYSVIAYVLDHRAEIDSYVADRRREAADLQAQVEARVSPHGVRARLLARRPSGAE